MRAFGYPKIRCLLCCLRAKTTATSYICHPDERCVLFHENTNSFTTSLVTPSSPFKGVGTTTQ
jgi:hypothetical protein